MINEIDLFWVPNFIALEIYFIFGTKFSWNEGIDSCFNVECVLLSRNFDFLGGYCSLPSVYCWLLLVTRQLLVVTTRYWCYCSLPLITARSHFQYELVKNTFFKEHLRSSREEMFCKRGAFKNFTIFTGRDLRCSLFFNKVAGL